MNGYDDWSIGLNDGWMINEWPMNAFTWIIRGYYYLYYTVLIAFDMKMFNLDTCIKFDSETHA